MAALPNETRNRILQAVISALKDNAEEIFRANKTDMLAAEENRISPAIIRRLRFDDHKLMDTITGLRQLIALPDPIGKTMLDRSLDEKLTLYRVSCPIGVVGIIFEARPDALVQISGLCIKSGNCAILKGGKETANTNRVLFRLIYNACVENGAPEGCLFQAEAHSEIDALLECHGSVDLLIPRGSNAFVQYIMEHTKIPVMGHADGVCHTYVHRDADPEKAIRVLVDAKTQYTAACNATEMLLMDRACAEKLLPEAASALREAGVTLAGTPEVCAMLDGDCEEIGEADFHREYLDMKISIRLVSDVDEAIAHINTYGSHHTDAIITENDEAAERFMQMVDSAGVYRNCSTRFADGFRYGFGAEVGISTSKLHARGPVGLEGLTTYKYKLYGDGHIVGDYASGVRQFHFSDRTE